MRPNSPSGLDWEAFEASSDPFEDMFDGVRGRHREGCELEIVAHDDALASWNYTSCRAAPNEGGGADCFAPAPALHPPGEYFPVCARCSLGMLVATADGMLIVASALALLIGLTLGPLGGGSISTVPILRYVLGVDAHLAFAMPALTAQSLRQREDAPAGFAARRGPRRGADRRAATGFPATAARSAKV